MKIKTISLSLPHAVTPIEAWSQLTSEPSRWLRWAFWIRDAISARFGVKRIGHFSGNKVEMANEGDMLDFFLVEHSSPRLLVLTERDRHLDVMTSIETNGPRLTITSSVVVHNLFGRAYMLPVGVAHRWIVSAMLRRLQETLLRGV